MVAAAKKKSKSAFQKNLDTLCARFGSEKGLHAACDAVVSSQTISAWRNGTREPSMQMLAAFAKSLTLSVHWLVTGEGVESPHMEASRIKLASELSRFLEEGLPPHMRNAGDKWIPSMHFSAEDGKALLGRIIEILAQDVRTYAQQLEAKFALADAGLALLKALKADTLPKALRSELRHAHNVIVLQIKPGLPNGVLFPTDKLSIMRNAAVPQPDGRPVDDDDPSDVR